MCLNTSMENSCMWIYDTHIFWHDSANPMLTHVHANRSVFLFFIFLFMFYYIITKHSSTVPFLTELSHFLSFWGNKKCDVPILEKKRKEKRQTKYHLFLPLNTNSRHLFLLTNGAECYGHLLLPQTNSRHVFIFTVKRSRMLRSFTSAANKLPTCIYIYCQTEPNVTVIYFCR